MGRVVMDSEAAETGRYAISGAGASASPVRDEEDWERPLTTPMRILAGGLCSRTACLKRRNVGIGVPLAGGGARYAPL